MDRQFGKLTRGDELMPPTGVRKIGYVGLLLPASEEPDNA